MPLVDHALEVLAHCAVVVYAVEGDAEAPQARHVLEHFGRGVGVQGLAVAAEVAQLQAAVAAGIDRPHLDVGFALVDVVLTRQPLSHRAVPGFVVDRGDFDLALGVVVA